MADLDNILSGQSEALSPTNEQETVTQVEGESQQQTEAATQEEGNGGTKMVPHEALHAEKQKVKRYTEEVADFRKQLSETNSAWERRMAQLVEAVRPPQVQPSLEDEIFSNPQGAIQRAVSPQHDSLKAEISSVREYYSKRDAVREFGEEGLGEAYAALDRAALSGDREAIATVAAVKQSMDPFGDIGRWHQKQKSLRLARDPKILPVLEKFGSDPSLIEKFEAFLANPQGNEQQQAAPAARAAVMPSNLTGATNKGARSGPAWSGPTALDDIFNRVPPSG